MVKKEIFNCKKIELKKKHLTCIQNMIFKYLAKINKIQRGSCRKWKLQKQKPH